MTKIRKIMVTTDFSETGNLALPYAVAMAQRFDSKLYVCHIIDLPATSIYGETINIYEVQQGVEEYAEQELAKSIGGYDVDWEPLIGTGNPAGEAARLALKKGVDLVIAASQGHSSIKKLLLGSVTEQLMHTLHCPILVVRDGSFSPNQGFKKILVGLDFSQDAHLALEYARELASEFAAELHVAHVIPETFFKKWLQQGADPVEDLEEGLRAKLYEEIAEMLPEGTAKIHILAGEPQDEIVALSDDLETDLIVLGVHGLGFVESLLVGSTTDRVVRMAECPVLSVRPINKDK